MSTQFISRVERDEPRKILSNSSDTGPGAYLIEGALKKELPGFAPFSSNTSKYYISFLNFYFLYGIIEYILLQNVWYQTI